MNLRSLTRVAGVLGGLCWIVRLLLDAVGWVAGALDPLYWTGLVLLAIALMGAGAGLVSKSAGWLRVIVGVAVPILVWSVLEVVRNGGDALLVDAVVGFAVLVVSVIGLRSGRRKARATSSHPHSRSHSH